MKLAKITLSGTSPLSFSKPHDEPKLPSELNYDYSARVWKSQLHQDDKGVYVPAQAVKNCLSNIAQFLGIKIEGGKGKTYGKKFLSGIMVVDNLYLDTPIEDVEKEKVFQEVGIGGKKSRIWTFYPTIFKKWTGSTDVYILDDIITENIFSKHIKKAGLFIGFLRWRPQNGGSYGRFVLDDLKWEVLSDDE